VVGTLAFAAVAHRFDPADRLKATILQIANLTPLHCCEVDSCVSRFNVLGAYGVERAVHTAPM